MIGLDRAARALRIVGLWMIAAAGTAAAGELEEIVVLGSNLPAAPQAVIEIIDRDTLALYGAAPVLEVLARVAGLHVDRNAGRGSLNSLYLRGADPNFTQIQIDGVPVNDPTNSRGGAYDLGALSAATVERIEILPAAASALYGSQALAGAINIITRAPRAGRELALSADSRGGAAAAFLTGAAGWSLSALTEQAGEEVDGSDYSSSELALRVRSDPSAASAWRIAARLQDAAARAFPDDSGGSRFAVSREPERREPREGQLDLGYRHTLGNGARVLADAHVFEHREDAFTPAVAPGLRDPAGLPAISSDSRYRRAQLRLQYHSAPGAGRRFALGLEWLDETGANDGVLDFGVFRLPGSFERARETLSGFGEWQWRPGPNWRLAAGARLARSEGDASLTPRLNLERGFAGGAHTVHLSFGEGYKQPSFYALGQPLIGNPALLDESSRSLQVGYRYAGDGGGLEVAGFAAEFDNLIDFEPGPPPRLVNRERVTTTGVEARIELRAGRTVRFDGSYVYADSEIEGSTARLRNRPRHKAALGLDWDPGARWRARLQTRYVGTRLDSSIPTGDRELEDYLATDAVLQWTRDERMRLSVAVDNLLDRHYQDSIGNPVAGRTVRFNLSYFIGAR